MIVAFPGRHDGFKRFRVEVVAVDVGHQHEIGLGQVGERLGTANRVHVHGLAVPQHEERGVVDRVDRRTPLSVAIRSPESLGSPAADIAIQDSSTAARKMG